MGNEGSQPSKLGQSLENDISVKWMKLEAECPLPARDSHCAAALGNHSLYVFGGVEQREDSIAESNDLMVLDVAKQSWRKIECKGDLPSPRAMATLATVGTKLYLFGGLNQDEGWLEGVYMFDTETDTWSRLDTLGTGPSARDKLTSAVLGNSIYVFGGFGPKTEEEEDLEEEEVDEDVEEDVPQDQEAAQFGWFNDLFVFNTENNTWSNPMHKNLSKPTPRAATSMCSMDKYLLIFGGRDMEGRRNDLHIFDTVDRRWETSLQITGRKPEQRSFHAAVAVGSRLVVLGGRGVSNEHYGDCHIFDTATKQWLQPTNQGVELPARGTHTATAVGDHIVVFGGSSEFHPELMQCNKYHNDTFIMKSADVQKGSALHRLGENQENVDSNIPVEQPQGKVHSGTDSDVPMHITH